MGDMQFTRKFSLGDQRDLEIKAILSTVYQALREKGYDPINQIVGYSQNFYFFKIVFRTPT